MLLGEGDDVDLVSVSSVEIGDDGRPAGTVLELWHFEDGAPKAFDEIVVD